MPELSAVIDLNHTGFREQGPKAGYQNSFSCA